ncbi:MarR family winged helix-turn-helix transcriptional regulator [Paracraurococcus lichenis]|uniref:MarR family winged helix-turn-helix transcriptional regulator n=1 Tax=Paracraurococcus lichenis TaxID=3064888 RepID=A0ABT9E9C5_9PROT|nr:MarR family winged helix-turn-helix transcriptional regulator [Paracraurococcus sp. LOR1-02]MDO9712670.1 MarR family winged helix-turn-helix transcriptional regulator [Paracraurococcus sp. LOR1-02]
MPRQTAAARPAARKASTAASASRPVALTITRPELLVDGSDFAFRKLVHGLFAFLARHEAVREGHGSVIGLAGIEYTVLISINHLAHQGDVSVRTVADHLHLSGAFVTTITNKLSARGLITKEVDPLDRRRVCLLVSAHGRDLLDRLAPTQRQVNDVQFGCLNAKEFHQLLDIVERLVESSDKAVALQRYLSESAGPAPLPKPAGSRRRGG